MDIGAVHGAIAAHFPGKARLHDLTRVEFLRFLSDLSKKTGNGKWDTGNGAEDLDRFFAGTAVERPWLRIRWLQRRLEWSDQRLINYVLWHGNRTGSRIDHIRWLSVSKARGIITGMERIKKFGVKEGQR